MKSLCCFNLSKRPYIGFLTLEIQGHPVKRYFSLCAVLIMRHFQSPTLFALALFVAILFSRLWKDSKREDDVSIAEPIAARNANGSEVSGLGDLPPSDSFGGTPTLTNTANSPDSATSKGNRSDGIARPDQGQEQTETNNLVATPPMGRLTSTNRPLATPLEWIWIPPGEFMMGSPETELGRRSNEGPQTQVTISHGFWLAKYEISLAQFRAVTGTPPRSPFARQEVDSNRAFANASWAEAMTFCAALTIRERDAGRLPEGRICRLPTEAEWEYACRAGTTTPFSFGTDEAMLNSFEWFRGNSDGVPHVGGSKRPNPWGLFNMHGNVAEWCLDFLGKYPGGSITNPVGAISGPFFAEKGGSWNDPAESCRSAFRHALRVSADSSGHIQSGFRVAIGLPVP